MQVDTHIHILPCVDDGPASVEEAAQMLRLLKSQGVTRMLAAPHFYHEAESVERFITKRKYALSMLKDFLGKDTRGVRFSLTAEVHISKGVSSNISLARLAIKNTKYLPIELPIANLDDDSYLEICKIIHKRRLYPLICNFERCVLMYSREQLEKVIGLPHAAFHINVLSFNDKNIAKMALEMHMNGKPIFVCSNAHNTKKRPPEVTINNIPLDDEFCRLVYKRITESNEEYFNKVVFS